MTERDTHFAVPAHHRDFQPQPHHSRNRDPGFERVIRDREAYYERDNREKERENRDRSERLDRDKEREREKDNNNKDRARDRDKERERDREREREQQLYGSDHRNNNNGGHGHVGGGTSRETGPPPPYRSRGEEDFDQEGGGREGGNSRYEREDRYVTAGANGGLVADTIFISNLPENVTEESLAGLLSDTGAIKVDRKSGAPMVKLFREKETGVQEAEVVLDDPRSATGIVNWFNGYDFKGSKIKVTLGHVPRGSSPNPHERRGDQYTFDYDRGASPHGVYRGGRGRGRYPDRPNPASGPPGVGRGLPPFGRGFSPSFRGPEEFPPGGESFGRNNPNVTPREGDWICSEPTCGNLNFARRTHCNNCNKPRREMGDMGMGVRSGHQGSFRGAPPHHTPFMGGGPPLGGRGLGRGLSGFGGPPGVLGGRGGPHEFDHGPPPRMSDFRPGREMRDHDDYHERDDFRDRDRFEGRAPFGRGGLLDRGMMDRGFFAHKDGEREDHYRDRRGLDHVDPRGGDRRPLTPPLRSRWARDGRERSRSPMHNLPREYLNRRRDDRRDERRDRREDLY